MIEVKQNEFGIICVECDGQTQLLSLNVSNQLIKCARMNNFDEFYNMLTKKLDIQNDHPLYKTISSLDSHSQWKFKEQFARFQTTEATNLIQPLVH